MLDRVREEPTRDTIDYASRFEGVSGSVVVLGANVEAISALAAREDVTDVKVFTTDNDGRVQRAIKDMAQGKVVLRHENPWQVQRRDVHHGMIDFLFVDLMPEPWEGSRVSRMRALTKELRPMAVNYRWQELDIAAEWLAAGMDPDKATAQAITVFRIETGLVVTPKTDEYAQHCMTVARTMTAQRRASR